MNKQEKLKLLRDFKEDRLTGQVIIPLLEKMGFKNITLTHGPLEKGKDLCFYKENDFEEREYTGVQVKAVDIHGSAGKTGNASEILTQAQQAFTHEFPDLYDNKTKHIDKYIVMTSGDIAETAKASIDGQLKALGYYKTINFVYGNKLVYLVDNKMPEFWEKYDCFNRYFTKMKEEFETIKDISALGQKDPVSLEEIYVSLKLAEPARERELPIEGDKEKIFAGVPGLREKKKAPGLKRERVLDPGKAVQQYHRLVIVGAPGAGKTTLLKYLALTFCKENLQKQERAVIPIPITLRELFQAGRSLRDYIDVVFQKYGFPEAKTFAEKELKAGKCLLLLDGFDELAARENQAKVTAEILAFVGKYQGCRMVVTSRAAGYHEELTGFTRLEVREFDDSQIKGFIEKWFGETGKAKAQSMQKAVLENDSIKNLARNPLMVSIIAVIYEEDRGELPQRRAKLYKRAVDVLLSGWDLGKKLKNRFDPDHKEFILRKLAYAGHCCNRRVLKEAVILEEIVKNSARLGLKETDAEPFLEEIWQRSFLLKQIASETYDFLHLSFQEYFTALELREQPGGIDTIMENIDKPWWEEPILLYAGIIKDAGPLVRRIQAEVPEDIFYSNLVLSGKCIADAEFTDPALKDDIAQKLWTLYREGEFPLLRARARVVLYRLKPANIIASLLTELQAKDPGIRRRAAEALGAIGSSEATGPLLQALSSDTESWVRANAAEALGAIGGSKAVGPLLHALSLDKGSEVRMSAADALGTIGSNEAMGPLLQALSSDKESSVRCRAALALGDIGSSEAIRPLLQAFSSDKDREVRGSAADALGTIGSNEAMGPLLQALSSDKDSENRGRAAVALGAIGSSEALGPLLQVLSSDNDSAVRGHAANALGYLGLSEAVGPLLQALSEDKDNEVRVLAASALGSLGNRKALGPLLKTLSSDKEGWSRWHAAYALEAIGDSEAIGSLLHALSSDEDNWVRLQAIEALGTIGDETVIPPLINALDDDKATGYGKEYYGKLYSLRVKDSAFEALEKISRREGKRITASPKVGT